MPRKKKVEEVTRTIVAKRPEDYLPYVIIASEDPKNLDMRIAKRPLHVKRLEELKAENRLILAGPNPAADGNPIVNGFVGSIIIAKFASYDDAVQWANDDPFVHHGVYEKVEVRRFVLSFAGDPEHFNTNYW